MADIKKVHVFGPGSTASTDIEVVVGETAQQLLLVVVPKLQLPNDAEYHLTGPDGVEIKGDVYKSVKDGDKLNIQRIDRGA